MLSVQNSAPLTAEAATTTTTTTTTSSSNGSSEKPKELSMSTKIILSSIFCLVIAAMIGFTIWFIVYATESRYSKIQGRIDVSQIPEYKGNEIQYLKQWRSIIMLHGDPRINDDMLPPVDQDDVPKYEWKKYAKIVELKSAMLPPEIPSEQCILPHGRSSKSDECKQMVKDWINFWTKIKKRNVPLLNGE